MKTAKKSMKRLFVLGLFILLGLAATFDTLAMAAGQPTISVESASGKVGEQVTVQVVMENNPGVASVYLDIDYDSSKLRLVDVQDTGLLMGKLFSENYDRVPYGLTWDDALNSSNTKDGAIATLTFKLLESCTSEEIRVSSPIGIVNYDLEFVPFVFQSGTIRTEDAAKEGRTTDYGSDAGKTVGSDVAPDSHTHVYSEKVTASIYLLSILLAVLLGTFFMLRVRRKKKGIKGRIASVAAENGEDKIS